MIYPNLELFDRVAIDTETTGLNWKTDEMFAFSVSTPDGKDYYYDIRRTPEALEWARHSFKHIKRTIGFHLKFDAHFLRKAGVELAQDNWADAGILGALLDEHADSFSLDYFSSVYGSVKKLVGIYDELAALFGGKADKSQAENFQRAPFELMDRYGKADTRATLSCFDAMMIEIHEQGLDPIAKMEFELIPVLFRMESRGVAVDLDLAEKNMKKLDALVAQRQTKLFAEAGGVFNPNSAPQVTKILNPTQDAEGRWFLPDGTFVPLTKGGKPSMSAKDVLVKSSLPVAKLIVKLKGAMKTRDTLLAGHVIGSAVNGRIHTSFNQTRMQMDDDSEYGTGSGRLSANGPNVQQISKRDPEMGELVRSCFIPELGQLWDCRDWSQMDFRVMAHYLRNPMIDKLYVLNPKTDFHQVVADMTGLPRKATPGIKGDAKSINLGLSFGMGKGKMAMEMGLPYAEVKRGDGSIWLKAGPEAEALFIRYHSSVKGIKTMLDQMSSIAGSRGYVKTGMGRRLRFPGGQKAYKAGAMIFQGTAADALKLKLVEVDRFLSGTDGRLLLNVHDEFDTSLPQGAEGKKLADGIREIVETFDGVKCPLHLRIPVRSSGVSAANWWLASKD